MHLFRLFSLFSIGGFFLGTFIISCLIIGCYLYFFWKPLLKYNLLIYLLIVYGIYMLSFLYTTFANPGIPEPVDPNLEFDKLPKEAKDAIKIIFCKKCDMYVYQFKIKAKERDQNSYHCSLCDVCIQST